MGEVLLRTDIYGQTSQYFSNASSSLVPDVKLPGYFLVNARLSWNNINQSGISAAVFGKNIGNRATSSAACRSAMRWGTIRRPSVRRGPGGRALFQLLNHAKAISCLTGS